MRQFATAFVLAVYVQLNAAMPTIASDAWSGSIRSHDALVYDAPGGTSIGSLAAATPVVVSAWHTGPALTTDNFTWADLGDGRFVHSSSLLHAPLRGVPPAPPSIVSAGHWADANLTQQIVTLYDGDRPVRSALMNSGRPGLWTESHEGIWPITSRVFNERMRGDGYDISGVVFTQYFTPDAEAIHLNYWLTDEERGIPRSHGCLGLAYDDAAFAWQFLSLDSVVFVHV
jgi:hypothetical protein